MTIKQDIQRYYDFCFSIDQLYAEWSKQWGLTSNDIFVLYSINENPGTCTQQQICKDLQLPKQTVNSILSQFESDGYVIKLPSEKDRRSKLISFTDKGKAYASKILSSIYEIEEAALYNMSPSQRERMLEGCEIFLQLLRKSFHEQQQKK